MIKKMDSNTEKETNKEMMENSEEQVQNTEFKYVNVVLLAKTKALAAEFVYQSCRILKDIVVKTCGDAPVAVTTKIHEPINAARGFRWIYSSDGFWPNSEILADSWIRSAVIGLPHKKAWRENHSEIAANSVDHPILIVDSADILLFDGIFLFHFFSIFFHFFSFYILQKKQYIPGFFSY